jgi:hypothetical protein
MRQIKIKKITLKNFKGVKFNEIIFNDACTYLMGANGTGKTTIFDAYLWCLFGKDSTDRKQFALKTLEEDGTATPRIEHEVEVLLLVDGAVTTLKRVYEENWTKKRGETEETFGGHKELFYYNGENVKLKEYNEKVNNICDSNVWSFIANPKMFLSKKEDEQRSILFGMVGEVSNEEIVANNKELNPILSVLQTQSIEDYKKEVSTECKRVKDELNELSIRIKEVEYIIDNILNKNADVETPYSKINSFPEYENITGALLLIEDAIRDRKGDLQDKIQDLNIELKSYEKEASLIEGFAKAKAMLLTEKVNALFQTVKFKLFDTQVNGEEVGCCKATINGVPYSDANNASKINMGIDIINAICKKEDVVAPVFIDNAESVNKIYNTECQQVRLVVTKDKKLTIE